MAAALAGLVKSRSWPLAEDLAQACEGIGWMSWIWSSQNQVGFTALVMSILIVEESGALMLPTWSGMPSPGVKYAQLAGLALSAAFSSYHQNSTSLDVMGC